jgi:hypothetical protein
MGVAWRIQANPLVRRSRRSVSQSAPALPHDCPPDLVFRAESSPPGIADRTPVRRKNPDRHGRGEGYADGKPYR